MMIKTIGMLVAAAVMSASAVPSGAAPAKALQPVPLKNTYESGVDLPNLAPWPNAMMIKPIAKHSAISWYVGAKLTSMVYSASDGLLRFTDLPYDEHVHLLNGMAILTSPDGTRHEFHRGDTFVVPKGWNGTWELKNGYREEITFETESINYAMKAWFGL